MKLHGCVIASALSALVIAALPLNGQGNLATILGTVKDASGGVVAGAKVTLTDEQTGIERTVPAEPNGDYRADALEPGTYTVSAEMPGFKKYRNTSIELVSRQIRRVDVALEVGTVAESVNVVAAAPVIQSEDATLTGRLTEKLIREFPVPLQGGPLLRYAVYFEPGISFTQTGIYGSRQGQTIWLLDGAEFQAYQFYNPNESLKEVKVVALNAPAEYSTPSASDATTKTGTNSLHAYALSSYGNNALNAIGTFVHTRPAGLPTYNFNFYGGGPVFIPKVYDGRNRTFFAITVQAQRATPQQQPQSFTVPTAAMRGGDLSILGKTIRNPFTGEVIPGAVIATNQINPTSARILAAIVPQPSRLGQPLNDLEAFWHAFTSRQLWWNVRFDHMLSRNDTLTGSLQYTHATSSQDQAVAARGVPGYGDNGGGFRRNISLSLANTHLFSPTVVNESRIRYFRLHTPTQPIEIGQEVLSRLGLVGVTNQDGPGGPGFAVSGYAPWAVSDRSVNTLNNFHFVDNLSMFRGKHSFKTGFEVKAYQQNLISVPSTTFGSFTFSGALSGDPFADFLFGVPSTLVRQNIRTEQGLRSKMLGGYFQDDWKVTANLSLQLGLRYEITPPQTDVNGLFYNYDPVTRSMVIPNDQALRSVQRAWPSNLVPVLTASQARFPERLVKTDKNNIAPRVGFAYRVGSNNKTVVRGAWGVYYYPVVGANGGFPLLQAATGPFGVTETFQNLPGKIAYVFPDPFGQAVGQVATPSTTAIASNFVQPYKQQWNFFLEREMALRTSLSIGYVGAADRKLAYQSNINAPLPSTTPFSQSLRPNPNVVNVTSIQNGGIDNYKTFQVEFRTEWAKGLWFKTWYNLSNQVTDVPNARFETISGTSILAPYDRTLDRGPGDFVVRHAWQSMLVWDVPIGKRQTHLRNMPAFANVLLGDWSLSSFFGARSGLPYSVTYSGRDPSNSGIFTGRADLVPGCNPQLSNPTNGRYFDLSCFALPPLNAGRFGNSPRNLLSGPGAVSFDLGAYKHIYLTERLRFRIGTQIANVLNHANFANPQADITAPNAGQIFANTVGTTQLTNMRFITFEGKLEF